MVTYSCNSWGSGSILVGGFSSGGRLLTEIDYFISSSRGGSEAEVMGKHK